MTPYVANVILHIIGTALGVGGATVSDLLFISSVKDGKIDAKEYGVLKLASKVVWTGLVIGIVTGIGFIYLYNTDPSIGRSVTEKVWAKSVIVAIILINGIIMHLKVFPALKKSAETGARLDEEPFKKKIPMVLAIGAISITSWYSALIIGAWRRLDQPFEVILGTYLSVLIFAIVVAQVVGRIFVKRMSR